MEEKDYNALYKAVVDAVVSIHELGIRSEKDITCLFVPDLMSYGLGGEIIVEIGGLFEKPKRTPEARQRLAKSVGSAVKMMHPDAMVECFITSFNPASGFWTSREDY